jgi:hypothetical protein
MTYTIAESTVNNSWWWTEELSETCRISFQNKLEKLVHLVGLIIRKFVTMHGHMNVKEKPNIPVNPSAQFRRVNCSHIRTVHHLLTRCIYRQLRVTLGINSHFLPNITKQSVFVLDIYGVFGKTEPQFLGINPSPQSRSTLQSCVA